MKIVISLACLLLCANVANAETIREWVKYRCEFEVDCRILREAADQIEAENQSCKGEEAGSKADGLTKQRILRVYESKRKDRNFRQQVYNHIRNKDRD